MIMGASRMTAAARADTGASDARREEWSGVVYRCVMTFVSFDDESRLGVCL